MFVMLMVVSISLSSCSDDDDDNGGGSSSSLTFAGESVKVNEVEVEYYTVDKEFRVWVNDLSTTSSAPYVYLIFDGDASNLKAGDVVFSSGDSFWQLTMTYKDLSYSYSSGTVIVKSIDAASKKMTLTFDLKLERSNNGNVQSALQGDVSFSYTHVNE